MLNFGELDSSAPDPFSVSVVLCTYNGLSRGFLRCAIDSVYRQTRPAHEVIVVDDGSSDGTYECISSVYPLVRVIRQSNAGLPSARNAGIRAARFSIVSFLDDDDVWEDTKLETQRNQMMALRCPEDFIFASRMRTIDANGVLGPVVAHDVIYSWWPACLIGNPVTGPSGVAIFKSAFGRVGYFDESLKIGEDYEFWIRCLKSGLQIAYSDATLLLYRVHDSQMTAPKNIRYSILEVNNIIMRYTGFLSDSARNVIWTIRNIVNNRVLLKYGEVNFSQFFVDTFLRKWNVSFLVFLLFLAIKIDRFFGFRSFFGKRFLNFLLQKC